jgi:hypothetical protein
MTQMIRKNYPVLEMIGASCVAAVMLTAAPALALSTSNNASRCVGANNYDQSQVSYPLGGGIQVSGGATIVCPIDKTTSGPGVSNDAMQGVDLFKMTGVVLPDSCTLRIYWSTTESFGDNLVATRTGNRGIPGAAQLNIGPVSWSEFWWDGVSWFYPEMTCSLQANQGILTYTVKEAGTKQTARIFSPNACRAVPPTATGQSGWGFIESPGGSGMFYKCPIVGTTAQFALLRSGNPNGFSLVDNVNGTVPGFPAFPFQTGSVGSPPIPVFPTVLYPGSVLPVQAPFTASGGFINATSTHLWFIKNRDPSGNGDFALISYRTTGNPP